MLGPSKVAARFWLLVEIKAVKVHVRETDGGYSIVQRHHRLVPKVRHALTLRALRVLDGAARTILIEPAEALSTIHSVATSSAGSITTTTETSSTTQ
jgi:hypothetical protein